MTASQLSSRKMNYMKYLQTQRFCIIIKLYILSLDKDLNVNIWCKDEKVINMAH